MKLPEGIYFHGCAWGIPFYIGVYKELIDLYGEGFGEKIKCYGDSIGCIAALTISLGIGWQDVEKLFLSVSKIIHNNNFSDFPSSDVHNYILDYIFRLAEEKYKLDKEEIVKKYLIDRLFIGITEYYSKHSWYVFIDFNSLKKAFHGSVHIPIYCRKLITYNNNKIIDGSFSFNPVTDLPNRGKGILKISTGNNWLWCDINPEVPLSVSECIAPCSSDKYIDIKNQGIESINKAIWLKEKHDTFHFKDTNKQYDHLILIFLWPIRLIEEYLPMYNYKNLNEYSFKNK